MAIDYKKLSRIVDGTEQVLYRVASCSCEDGKRYNLNKVVGKIGRYI